MSETILVTGGAGFIGSHVVDELLSLGHRVVVLDLLTYAGSKTNLAEAQNSGKFTFIRGDICDGALVSSLLRTQDISHVMHLAAETHVDNSISDAAAFIQTNLVGTYTLLAAARAFWEERGKPQSFRFLHVSTDEVFGTLSSGDAAFSETTAYAPNSPYSASKAGSDHLARAWHHTYGLPVIITNCSNNFGPRQHREKLIPLMITRALEEKPLPVYGDGSNIRDWLFVRDHARGLAKALFQGKPGDTYCFGGECEKANIEVVETLCALLDESAPRRQGRYRDLISFVTDRPGHDWRYAIDCGKAKRDLGYEIETGFETGLEETVSFYLSKTARAA